MKKYKAKRKGFIHILILFFGLIPIIVYLIGRYEFNARPFFLLPLLIPIAVILWIYFDTYYGIQDNYLFYRSAFLRGKIDIHKIREIQQNKTLWSGIKPALSKNGLIIKFNKYDEVYIAPDDNEKMVNDLISINPNIQVSK
ncbi:MAG: PH domain-containing protein [Flavobacterium sp.]